MDLLLLTKENVLKAAELKISIEFFQSNVEGDIVSKIQLEKF